MVLLLFEGWCNIISYRDYKINERSIIIKIYFIYAPSTSYNLRSCPVPLPVSGIQEPCSTGHENNTPVLLTAAFIAVPFGALTMILEKYKIIRKLHNNNHNVTAKE